jgi:hypothetical protein
LITVLDACAALCVVAAATASVFVASPPMPVPVCVVPRVSLLLKPTGCISSASDDGGVKLMWSLAKSGPMRRPTKTTSRVK